MIASWIPVLFWSSRIREAALLFPLADLPQPYFIPDHAGILYFWTPLIAWSACIFLLSPGLILSIVFGGSQKAGQWVLTSMGISIPVLSGVVAVVQQTTGSPLTGNAFAMVVIGCWLVSVGLLFFRWRSGREMSWPLGDANSRFTLISIGVMFFLFLVGLLPKFLWDNFHGDGVHAYETARLLLFQPLPFWNPAAGPIANYPGLTSMLFAFPASWFIRLFGEFEISVRLPMLIYMIALFGGVTAISEEGQSRALRYAALILVWLALTVYLVVVAFNVTYNPYSADIALPPARETLLVASYLGYILSFLRRQSGWMLLFTFLTYASLPTGLFLMGLWIIAVFLVWRPIPWRQLIIAAGFLAACMLLNVVLPHALNVLGVPPPGREFNTQGIAERVGFYGGDIHRILFVLIPCGILPAIAIFAWTRQDRIARTVSVTTVATFIFFYFQRNTALNHFMPVMVLPLITYWRIHLSNPWGKRNLFLFLTAAAGIFALWISLPQNYLPHTTARIIGSALLDRSKGYESFDPAAFRRPALLRHLFPLTWSRSVPSENYGGSPQVWYFYSRQNKTLQPHINYLLQPSGDPPPEGMTLIATEHGSSLYVADQSLWKRHRALRPPTPPGCLLYSLERSTLFKRERRKR